VGMGRRNYLFRLFMFMIRMGDECVMLCPFNYANTSERTSKGYICTPKQCGDRTPWSNESCSMTEDFPLGVGGEEIECYMSRVGDGMKNCVLKGDCFSGYPGVCVFFIVCTDMCFMWGCICFLDEARSSKRW
jgi:hypothetical protein